MGVPQIVTVDVSIQTPAAPSALQQTGAFISQGATNTSAQTLTLLTQLSDLTPHLTGSAAVTSITQTSGTATVTTTAPHGFPSSDTVWVTIAGSTIAAYNGTFLCTVTGTSTFTYLIPSGTASPATGTIVYTVEDVAELLAMATTYFAQGTLNSVYVLELGVGSPADGIAALTTYLTANPNTLYAVLVPRTWNAQSSLTTLI